MHYEDFQIFLVRVETPTCQSRTELSVVSSSAYELSFVDMSRVAASQWLASRLRRGNAAYGHLLVTSDTGVRDRCARLVLCWVPRLASLSSTSLVHMSTARTRPCASRHYV